MHLQQRLRKQIHILDVGNADAAEQQHVIHGAAINVSEGEKRNGQVNAGFHVEDHAGIGGIGTDVGVRQHHSLWLTRRARCVDDRRQLARKHLRRTHAVRGHLSAACGGN